MTSPLKAFSVHGPFDIPLEPGKTGKMVAMDICAFWDKIGDLRRRRGVYLFAIRAGKGITPIYVGKAAKQSFEDEVFTAHKRSAHYTPALLDYAKGTAVMYFVAHPQGNGAINQTLIDQIETFLIDIASTKNPTLSNVRKKPKHKWRIKGVVRGKQGETREEAKSFKAAVGIN